MSLLFSSFCLLCIPLGVGVSFGRERDAHGVGYQSFQLNCWAEPSDTCDLEAIMRERLIQKGRCQEFRELQAHKPTANDVQCTNYSVVS